MADEFGAHQSLLGAKGPGGAAQRTSTGRARPSRAFAYILRHQFGSDQESFLSFKSGPVYGHYHNDDQSFHWYHRGTPIALDYNCSYHPRGDHAALHNSLTLGKSGTVRHNTRNTDVEALEQPEGAAKVVIRHRTEPHDVVVGDRHIDSLLLSPLDPYDSEFNRNYAHRKVDADHRRLLLLRKQAKNSSLSDYLVVRDEIRTTESPQVDLHLLARDVHIEGNRILLAASTTRTS